MRKNLVLICLLQLQLFAPAVAQQFSSQAPLYGISHLYGEGTAGGGISFADFTNDGLDDLSLASSTGESIYFYQNTGSGVIRLSLLPDLKGEIKHILWVDFDNDGDKDLYVTMADDHNRLFVNDGNLLLTDETESRGLPTKKYTSFGACWGDYNRDGWLDLYYGVRRIESDGLPNISRLFQNIGGRFVEVTLATGTEDGGKTPFCSSFIDFNNDNWPDIYTAHDRKRGNTLLKNNRNGTFSQVGLQTATDLKMDGMSVSTSDFNSDGFFDIYVSNSEAGNALFVNQKGEKFKNQAAERGVGFFSVAWGTNFLDGDNDGDEDLYVSGMLPGASAINSQYYVNLYPGDIFVKGVKIPQDTASSFNNAVGDINNDGYADIGVLNVGPYPSLLFVNQGGSNRYIKLQLEGVKSNREGIGSVIAVYHGIRRQFRYTQCGIGFMGQNSDTEIFGTGTSTFVDSVIITWPTGHIDRFYKLETNKRYVCKEGSSTQGVITVDPDVRLISSVDRQLDTKSNIPVVSVAQDGTLLFTWRNEMPPLIQKIVISHVSGQITAIAEGPEAARNIHTSRWISGFYIATLHLESDKILSIPFLIWN